jgi:hypothetical protein
MCRPKRPHWLLVLSRRPCYQPLNCIDTVYLTLWLCWHLTSVGSVCYLGSLVLILQMKKIYNQEINCITPYLSKYHTHLKIFLKKTDACRIWGFWLYKCATLGNIHDDWKVTQPILKYLLMVTIQYNSVGLINTQYRCDYTIVHAGHVIL